MQTIDTRGKGLETEADHVVLSILSIQAYIKTTAPRLNSVRELPAKCLYLGFCEVSSVYDAYLWDSMTFPQYTVVVCIK